MNDIYLARWNSHIDQLQFLKLANGMTADRENEIQHIIDRLKTIVKDNSEAEPRNATASFSIFHTPTSI